jgi:hypothetical protein
MKTGVMMTLHRKISGKVRCRRGQSKATKNTSSLWSFPGLSVVQKISLIHKPSRMFPTTWGYPTKDGGNADCAGAHNLSVQSLSKPCSCSSMNPQDKYIHIQTLKICSCIFRIHYFHVNKKSGDWRSPLFVNIYIRLQQEALWCLI